MENTRPLLLTWIALLALLATTAAAAWAPLGWVNMAISLAIATIKTVLVALMFMRLKRSSWLLRLASLAGLVTLSLLFVLSGADYATRPHAPATWQQPATVAPRFGGR